MEVWDQPPAGVSIRNPYFDSTSLDLVTAFITDVGVVAPVDVASVCSAVQDDVGGAALASLL